jgi:outer membrane lipoprotein SlyB
VAGIDSKKKLITITAVSAFAVGAVAAAVLTGVLPHTSTAPTEQAASPAESPAPPPAPETAAVSAPPLTRAPIHKRAVTKSRPPAAAVANTDAPPPPSPQPSFESCTNCGVVQSIESFTEKGPATGGGAVAGGLLGGILGHQIGHGRGKDLATVAGAVGGALAGNAMEKNANQVTRYHVAVRMNDGTQQIFTLDAPPSLATGDHVVIVNGAPERE